MCGTAGDSDCTDGSCFDFEVGTGKDYAFELGAGVDNAPAGSTESALQRLPAATCAEGSADPECGSGTEVKKFLLHDLGCTGEGCVRESSAGSFGACLTGGERANIQNIETQKPVKRGLMTLFGTAAGSLASSNYPPDVVTTEYALDVDVGYVDSQYDAYRNAVVSLVATGSASGGVPYRRVLTVPVVSCADGALGRSANTVLGFLCLFITKIEPDVNALDGTFYGEFVDRCEASGEQGASIPAMSGTYDGPVEIVLYKDPDSIDS